MYLSNDRRGAALGWASLAGHLDVVKYLLAKECEIISNDAKARALKNAAGQGHLPIVQHLLTKESEAISNDDKGTVLKYAAAQGHLSVVQHLLEKEGRTISNEYKYAALRESERYHYQDVRRLLYALLHPLKTFEVRPVLSLAYDSNGTNSTNKRSRETEEESLDNQKRFRANK